MLSKLRISLLILLTCIVSPSLGQTEKIRFESLVDYAQKRVKQDAFARPFLDNIAARVWTDKTGAFKQKASFAVFSSDTVGFKQLSIRPKKITCSIPVVANCKLPETLHEQIAGTLYKSLLAKYKFGLTNTLQAVT